MHTLLLGKFPCNHLVPEFFTTIVELIDQLLVLFGKSEYEKVYKVLDRAGIATIDLACRHNLSTIQNWRNRVCSNPACITGLQWYNLFHLHPFMQKPICHQQLNCSDYCDKKNC